MALLEMNRNTVGATADGPAITHKGMAHFAGTGPRGMTCGQCEHWKKIGEKARAHVCEQARSMGAKCNSPIPPEARACKYFVYKPAAK